MTTTTQMNIQKFLDLCAGNWFSQRTYYDLVGTKTESNKADLSIAHLAAEDSKVVQLCQEHRLNSQQVVGALTYSWDTSVDWGKPKKQGTSIMVFVAEGESDNAGKLITSTASKTGKKSSGTYELGQDEALTLTINMDDATAEERLWFASDNLRLRSTVLKNATGNTSTTFYSEIRKTAPQK